MVKRSNHYDVAFEDYLRDAGIPYVAVNEARRAVTADVSLKSMDFIVTSSRFQNLLVDVKGRQFPSGSSSTRRSTRGRLGGHKWENWATQDDVDSLLRWQAVFGEGFRSLLIFAYELLDPRACFELGRPYDHRGRLYSFFGVWAEEYQRAMRTRSSSWETVSVSTRDFRDLRMPVAELLRC